MRILIFGDSIVQGFWDVGGGWVQRIRRKYERRATEPGGSHTTIFNLGISGDASNDVVKRFKAETEARYIDEGIGFVFAIGLNDSRRVSGLDFMSLEKYQKNLEELVSMASQYSNKITFVGITPCAEELTNPVPWGNAYYTDDRIRQFNQTLEDFCRTNGISFVDVFTPFAEAQAKSNLLSDGLHPNSEGHQLIADTVMHMLERTLKAE